MTTNDLSRTTLPLAQEVQAAAKGQRALAAYLATHGEIQRIQIYDCWRRPKTEPHLKVVPNEN